MDMLGQSASSRCMAIPELVEAVMLYLRQDFSDYDWRDYEERDYKKRIRALRSAALVNRLWHRIANPLLYHSIIQTYLPNKRARTLNCSLTRNPRLADLIRHVELDMDTRGCPALLSPLFQLHHLTLNLSEVDEYLLADLFDSLAFVNNAASRIKHLTIVFGSQPGTDLYDDALGRFVGRLAALTHLHLNDVCTIDLAQTIVSALPNGRGLLSLLVDDCSVERSNLLDLDSWKYLLEGAPNLQELCIRGSANDGLLHHLPKTLKNVVFESCDGLFAYQVLLQMANPTWLPNLSRIPFVTIDEEFDLAFLYQRRGTTVPSKALIKATIEAAVVGMESRNGLIIEEQALSRIRALKGLLR